MGDNRDQSLRQSLPGLCRWARREGASHLHLLVLGTVNRTGLGGAVSATSSD